MSILQLAVRWIVDTVTWLPEGFRPGIFAAVLVTAGWHVKTHPRLIWHWLWRSLAVAVECLVGILLHPEYVITSSRRRRGAAPSQA